MNRQSEANPRMSRVQCEFTLENIVELKYPDDIGAAVRELSKHIRRCGVAYFEIYRQSDSSYESLLLKALSMQFSITVERGLYYASAYPRRRKQ